MILIQNGTVIPCDGTKSILKNTSIAVDDGKISDIGQKDDLVRKHGNPEKIIDARNRYVLPGFINTHTHLFQVLSRGLGMDMTLDKWWESAVGKVAPKLGPDECYYAALAGCVESIRSGTTCINDFMYLGHRKNLSDGVIKAFVEVGLRGVLSRGITDAVEKRAPPLVQNLGESLKDFERLHAEYNNTANGLIRVWVAPSSFWATTLEAFEQSINLARKLGTRITFHCSEAKFVVEQSLRVHGKKDLMVLADKGLLGPDMLAVHCVWLDDQDIAVFAKNGVKVSHCPVTNMLLADGAAPIRKMLDRQIACSLGTDGAASNNHMDMMAVMKAAALLQKVHLLDPTALSAWKVLEMATIDGAKALGLEREIGSIHKGFRADVQILNLHKVNTTPTYDPVTSIVYSASQENVETVIVNGRVLMDNHQLLTVDEEHIIQKVENIGEMLASSMN